MTHAPHRAHGHGERSNARRGPVAPPPSGRSAARWHNARRPLVLTLLVAAFGMALALLTPGIASAEGEAVTGTLQTSRSGPIDGVGITVETAGVYESRAEVRARPAIQDPIAVPELNAETLSEDPSVGARSVNRTAREISTGLTPSPKSPSRMTSATVGTA